MNELNAMPVKSSEPDSSECNFTAGIVEEYIIGSILCFFMAVPIWFLWNWLVPVYFIFLPEVWRQVPFFHAVGLIWLIFSVRSIIFPSSHN